MRSSCSWCRPPSRSARCSADAEAIEAPPPHTPGLARPDAARLDRARPPDALRGPARALLGARAGLPGPSRRWRAGGLRPGQERDHRRPAADDALLLDAPVDPPR